MKEVVIVDYLRTPFSRSRPNAPERDLLNDFRMDVLTGRLIKTMIERKGINPKEIGDVLVGAAFQVVGIKSRVQAAEHISSLEARVTVRD